jgi:hypothetical protein
MSAPLPTDLDAERGVIAQCCPNRLIVGYHKLQQLLI